uniref:Myb/SANT-like DNA-binding domain-containing protein n=1 Tax=Chenopodium quinoa TaxID=63459 RepID=A0A803LDJ1_CHEQI
MDEDDDTRSHTSIGSEPPSPPSGQITVTVAAAPPSSTPSSSTPQPPPQLSQRATSVLIDAWGERYMELSRGNLKQKHWKEVADIVSSREDFTKVPKTDIQCKNRIDTVKKKYKVEKQKVVSGCGPSRWPFFDRLDRLIGPAAATPNSNTVMGLGPLSTATVSTGGPLPHGKAVPVGIPVWGSSVRDLTRAIMKFGEAYEAAESAKLQHIVEMEMQRMKFAKELELQRMKFMMKTQLELSQLNN